MDGFDSTGLDVLGLGGPLVNPALRKRKGLASICMIREYFRVALSTEKGLPVWQPLLFP